MSLCRPVPSQLRWVKPLELQRGAEPAATGRDCTCGARGVWVASPVHHGTVHQLLSWPVTLDALWTQKQLKESWNVTLQDAQLPSTPGMTWYREQNSLDFQATSM